MNTVVWTYAAYLVVSVALTVWVAATLRKVFHKIRQNLRKNSAPLIPKRARTTRPCGGIHDHDRFAS